MRPYIALAVAIMILVAACTADGDDSAGSTAPGGGSTTTTTTTPHPPDPSEADATTSSPTVTTVTTAGSSTVHTMLLGAWEAIGIREEPGEGEIEPFSDVRSYIVFHADQSFAMAFVPTDELLTVEDACRLEPSSQAQKAFPIVFGTWPDDGRDQDVHRFGYRRH